MPKPEQPTAPEVGLQGLSFEGGWVVGIWVFESLAIWRVFEGECLRIWAAVAGVFVAYRVFG